MSDKTIMNNKTILNGVQRIIIMLVVIQYRPDTKASELARLMGISLRSVRLMFNRALSLGVELKWVKDGKVPWDGKYKITSWGVFDREACRDYAMKLNVMQDSGACISPPRKTRASSRGR